MFKNPEISSFLAKYGALITYILIGLAGKFGYDMVTGRRITVLHILSTGLMAVFVGYLTWQWCLGHPAWAPGITVPIATLMSRDVILFLTLVDWMSVMKILTGKTTRKQTERDI